MANRLPFTFAAVRMCPVRGSGGLTGSFGGYTITGNQLKLPKLQGLPPLKETGEDPKRSSTLKHAIGSDEPREFDY